MTDREIEILKALKTLGYSWIARDSDDEDHSGTLFAYLKRPEKRHITWECGGNLDRFPYIPVRAEENEFKWVKWSADNPVSIDDLLKDVKEPDELQEAIKEIWEEEHEITNRILERGSTDVLQAEDDTFIEVLTILYEIKDRRKK